MTEKPLILVTNDDGIHSPGISSLIEVAQKFGDVVVVAPDKAQSGMGHAITINSTIRVNPITTIGDVPSWSCTGTPVDCVKMAVNKLLPRTPVLCLSGINHGANHSINIIYSGTMSAAMEGALEGIPSIGFSLLDYAIGADFTAAKVFAEKIIGWILKDGLPAGVC
ncbi:MAG TPA: 5'/3'-nucleotidase SurE, partial [Bacteroidia bacterium]|nr:5'/3'-nucleotidase SurE [Bacteroidia bacterium]